MAYSHVSKHVKSRWFYALLSILNAEYYCQENYCRYDSFMCSMEIWILFLTKEGYKTLCSLCSIPSGAKRLYYKAMKDKQIYISLSL